MKFLLFFISLYSTYGFNLCVVGGKSGLGRELVYQCISSNKKVLALTNDTFDINYPYRGQGLDKKNIDKVIKSNKLKVDLYDNFKKYKFDNLVFTLGAGPFEEDYSDIVTENILKNMNNKVDQIILMSAYGVGDSLKKSNIGIKVMDSIYLRDTYRAKNRQEKLVTDYAKKNNINTFIIRPKGLSYGQNIYSIKSRQQQAKEILEYLYLN
tara:strand:- start:708 stop:1337 length:630 start_codon:yes stop_codon:yes gene_type:complete